LREPVKPTALMSGFDTSAVPSSCPAPNNREKTPGARPHRRREQSQLRNRAGALGFDTRDCQTRFLRGALQQFISQAEDFGCDGFQKDSADLQAGFTIGIERGGGQRTCLSNIRCARLTEHGFEFFSRGGIDRLE
jgi:hypothetical protein